MLPSAAREDIAQIRQWTDKPVRWLVNTHWHIDHNAGNRAYLDAFPGLAIVAQRDTKAMMDEYNPNVPARFVAAYRKQADAMQKSLDAGKGENGRPLSAEASAALADDIAALGDFVAEYQEFRYQSPTLAIERSIAIDLGGRGVEVKFLGRGNTLGDVVVQLPAEKIVATGDLLDHPVPYMLGGFPREWIETLDALEKLGASTFVPGHGEVLQRHDLSGRGARTARVRDAPGACRDRAQGQRRDARGGAEGHRPEGLPHAHGRRRSGRRRVLRRVRRQPGPQRVLRGEAALTACPDYSDFRYCARSAICRRRSGRATASCCRSSTTSSSVAAEPSWK